MQYKFSILEGTGVSRVFVSRQIAPENCKFSGQRPSLPSEVWTTIHSVLAIYAHCCDVPKCALRGGRPYKPHTQARRPIAGPEDRLNKKAPTSLCTRRVRQPNLSVAKEKTTFVISARGGTG
jgi:hypothetical protein